MPIGEQEDAAPLDDEDDPDEDEGVQENARQTLALLRSGRMLTDEELLGFVFQLLHLHMYSLL